MDNIRLIASLCLSIWESKFNLRRQRFSSKPSACPNILLSVCIYFLMLVTDLKEKSLNEATCDLS